MGRKIIGSFDVLEWRRKHDVPIGDLPASSCAIKSHRQLALVRIGSVTIWYRVCSALGGKEMLQLCHLTRNAPAVLLI